MQSFEFTDIIIFAMVAGFIILRLRSVLGRKTGNERPPPGDPNAQAPNEQANGRDSHPVSNIAAPEDRVEDNILRFDANPEIREGLKTICRADSRFDPDQFLTGAKSAYEMILSAFWDGNLDNVKVFLGSDVYASFNTAIEAREKAGHQVENRILETTNAEIIEAGMEKRMAEITLRFVSDIVAVTRDSDGKLVEGDESDAIEIAHVWTFDRDVTSGDPNWTLAKTRAN